MEELIKKIDSQLDALAPITLEEMSCIKLMNRIDKKYIINLKTLPILLDMAKDDYYIQFTDGKRRFLYRSCYYDTDDAYYYTIHQNGHRVRQKIRVREYVYSNLVFLEIKNKNNKGRTSKVRIKVPDVNIYENPEAVEYLNANSWFTTEEVKPRLQNSFFRVTLVNKAKTERLTIDMCINFKSYKTGNECSNPEMCIIELKRDGNKPSPFLEYFSKLRIKAKGISKYCYGMMLTESSLKRNRFKGKLRYIAKVTGFEGGIADTYI